MDTKVPLLDGRTLTLTQITEEFNKGERLWAYSCDPNTGKFAPGLISWAGVTRKNEKVMKITLDNNKTITCTLDHKFPVWNKGTVEAQNLQIGDSMIPFYSRETYINPKYKTSRCTQIFENESKEWKFVHRLISEWKDSNNLKNQWTFDDGLLNAGKSTRKGKTTTSSFERFNCNNLENVCKNKKFKSVKEYSNSVVYKNHKIKNIEFLEEAIDVGTLTIDRDEIYHNYHTFALDSGIYTCNSNGEVKDDKKFMAMLEDFWLPRREGGRGTEITTLPGGQNLGEITDIEYFKKKLYRSLNVPASRMDGEGGFNLGRSSEILRDEVKFSKFVARLRKRFSYMFSDMLRTQLILKNIITPEDWNIMDEHIQYDFLYDNHFAELKDAELLNERLNMLQVAEPYVGKYFSQDYIRRKVLRQTDIEILEQDKQIKKEIKTGVIPDPNQAPIDPQTGMPMDQTAQMDLGKPVNEPDLESQSKDVMSTGKPVEMPKGGEI
jgi:hypothetical protein